MQYEDLLIYGFVESASMIHLIDIAENKSLTEYNYTQFNSDDEEDIQFIKMIIELRSTYKYGTEALRVYR